MGIIPEMASNSLLLYNDTYICCIQTFCLWRYKVVIIWTFKIGFDVLIPTHLQKGTQKANLLLAVTFLFILCDSKCMLSCKKHVLDWFKKRDLANLLREILPISSTSPEIYSFCPAWRNYTLWQYFGVCGLIWGLHQIMSRRLWKLKRGVSDLQQRIWKEENLF